MTESLAERIRREVWGPADELNEWADEVEALEAHALTTGQANYLLAQAPLAGDNDPLTQKLRAIAQRAKVGEGRDQ